MNELPQDRWPLEKRREHERRRWWKYVCKAEEYVPSVFLKCLTHPRSYVAIAKTAAGGQRHYDPMFALASEGLLPLEGHYRIRVIAGRVHTDSRLPSGLRLPYGPSDLRRGYNLRMSRGHQRGVGAVWLLHAEERLRARREIKEQVAAELARREIRKRSWTNNRSAEASTALFFKLAAGASAIP